MRTPKIDRLTAIDPGAASGFAQFAEHKLFAASTFSGEEFPEIWHRGYAQTLVLEVPRIYPGNSKGDPNDIVKLAMRAGEIRGYYARAAAPFVFEVFPRTWKGNVPKEIHHGRVLAALDEQERGVLAPHARRVTKTNPHGLDHNMLDAVGLGLWFLKRL